MTAPAIETVDILTRLSEELHVPTDLVAQIFDAGRQSVLSGVVGCAQEIAETARLAVAL